MKIIIGLGNPGKKYEHTRHNVGFAVLDELRKVRNFPEFAPDKKFEAEISEGTISGQKVILVKPETFMNLSGVCARKIMDFYKLSPADFFVVQDELDLPIGKYKIATDSSAAGHNGIKNIIDHFGTQTFTRLRIGIATPKSSDEGEQGTDQQDAACLRNAHDFVLDRFTTDEQKTLNNEFPVHLQEIETFIAS